ncbi:MAG: hypothetical protein QM518_05660 [Verrucomicrobiota bacterium]|nr:hypothetical protein [Verrucomicrobiota bacterium]
MYKPRAIGVDVLIGNNPCRIGFAIPIPSILSILSILSISPDPDPDPDPDFDSDFDSDFDFDFDFVFPHLRVKGGK